MRYADFAYQHIKSADVLERDPERANVIDRRAQDAGFSNGADYIDNVMGRSDTHSFEGSNNRICWMNSSERLMGWINKEIPEQSTVIPRSSEKITERSFDSCIENEAKSLGVRKDRVKNKGPLSIEERTVDAKSIEAIQKRIETDRSHDSNRGQGAQQEAQNDQADKQNDGKKITLEELGEQAKAKADAKAQEREMQRRNEMELAKRREDEGKSL